MDSFVVYGGRPLRGSVRAGGSKNAALPVLFATLLTGEPCEIGNVPDLRDIRTTFQLLEHLGKKVERSGGAVRVTSGRQLKTQAPYELVKQMRASFLAAGPLLARFGRARVALPGGCAIGLRPIDIHLKGFEALGARVAEEQGDVLLRARALKPARIKLSFPSVGATENLMMAAAAIDGETRIEGAAREPEISDLGAFLAKMGAEIKGLGTPSLSIRGRAKLGGALHEVIGDRIEAGTLLIAAAATRGDIEVEGADPAMLRALISALRRCGAKVEEGPDRIRLRMAGRPAPVSVRTQPHPGFPTDLQAPWMALMCLARGRSSIVETVFEKRFLHAAELARMGARIRVDGDAARVEGARELLGAPVMASDLRAGAALVVAGLAAKGGTEISRVYHIDRGYERLEDKLGRLGARIRRVR